MRGDIPLRADENEGAFNGDPSFSFRHRLLRVCWVLVWLIFAAWTPPFLHKWRILLARMFGARISFSASLYSSARIWYPPNLIMHERSALGPGVDCYTMAIVEIGPYVVVSQGAHLCTGSHDIHRPSFQIFAKPIVIEGDAWVCAGAFVGPGVTIGRGAVLGARAVTFKDLQPWQVYIGNPAIRKSSRTVFSRYRPSE